MLQIINYILTNYISSIKEPLDNSFSKHHPMFQLIQKDFPKVVQSIINDDARYKVEGSVGKGNWTETPWLSIFSKKITLTATKGIYLVYLFKSDMSGFYLSLNQGATYLKEHFTGKGEIEELTFRFRSQLQEAYSNVRFVSSIALSTNSRANAKGYEKAHLLGFEYKLSQLPTEAELISDLMYLLGIYKDIEEKWLIDQDSIAEFYRNILEDKINEQVDEQIYLEEEAYQQATLNYDIVGESIPVGSRSKTLIQNTRTWSRNPAITAYSIKAAGYVCAIDSKHETFLLPNGRRYMEGHHLIPVHKQDHPKLKEYTLDSMANIVSLCPNCHRAIHYGDSRFKKEILSQLYVLKQDALIAENIYIDLEDLYELYDVAKA